VSQWLRLISLLARERLPNHQLDFIHTTTITTRFSKLLYTLCLSFVRIHIARGCYSALALGEHDELQYYGPYNGLLNDLFPKQKYYIIQVN